MINAEEKEIKGEIMSCELVITIDANGDVLTTLAGKPANIDEAYKNLEKDSLVAVVFRQILECSKKELDHAFYRTEE